MAIAFRDEEFGEALKDFVGQIVATDYAEEPFDMKGAPGITRKGKVLCIKIKTDVYDKEQYEWYPPSNVKKTKTGKLQVSYRAWTEDWQAYRIHFCLKRPITEAELSRLPVVKWQYFVEALNATGAMKDISIAGAKDDERMTSFAQSLLGMKFRFQEQECESLVKEKGGVQKKFNMTVPVEYLGKTPIEAAAAVKQTTIGEPATTASPGGVD